MVEKPNYIFFPARNLKPHQPQMPLSQLTTQFAVTPETSWGFFSPPLRLLAPGRGQKKKDSSLVAKITLEKKEEHLALEEIGVAFTHFPPSEDSDIPSLLKRTPHHLAFTVARTSSLSSVGKGLSLPGLSKRTST